MIDSETFPTSRWSLVEPFDTINLAGGRNHVLDALAELAWGELGHMKAAEKCELSGEYSGTFYKVAHNQLLVVTDEGWGEYVHHSDALWRRRRDEVEADVRRMELGEVPEDDE